MTSTFNELGIPKDMSASADEFYPVRWVEIFKLWLPEFLDEVEEKTKESTFLPLYQSFPSEAGFDLYRRPPKGSYLSNLLDRFVPDDSAASYAAEDIRHLTGRWLRSNVWAIEWLESAGGPSWRALLKH